MFPTPFLARSGLFRGQMRHLAFGSVIASSSGGAVRTDLHARVSADGRHWFRHEMDIGPLGRFYPSKLIRHRDLLVMVGRDWDSANAYRAATYTSPVDDGRRWTHRPTSIDGAPGASLKAFVDVASNGSTICALCDTGERAVSDNGIDWSGYGNIGFSGSANTITAAGAVFLAGGQAGQMFSATNPRTNWTPRNAGFGGTAIQKLRAGNVFVAAGRTQASRIATAALGSVDTWTGRADPLTSGFDVLEYGADSGWVAARAGGWTVSLDGTAWEIPDVPPAGAGARSLLRNEDKWIAFHQNGDVSLSEDRMNWDTFSDSGLAPSVPYFATLFLGDEP